MRAIGYTTTGDPSVLEVTKVRSSSAPDGGGPKILGFDVVRTVREVGAAVLMFEPGDEVW